MALNSSNSSNLEQLVLKGLIVHSFQFYSPNLRFCAQFVRIELLNIAVRFNIKRRIVNVLNKDVALKP